MFNAGEAKQDILSDRFMVLPIYSRAIIESEKHINGERLVSLLYSLEELVGAIKSVCQRDEMKRLAQNILAHVEEMREETESLDVLHDGEEFCSNCGDKQEDCHMFKHEELWYCEDCWSIFNNSKSEALWQKLTDVPFDELPDGSLVLATDFDIWTTGTPCDDIWRWFDNNHSKGVGWLMNKMGK